MAKPTPTIAIQAIPYDGNSSFALGAAQGPKVIQEALVNGSLNKGCENGYLLDFDQTISMLPALEICSPETFFDRIYQQTHQQLANGKRLLTLGGDHSISYPVVHAYHQFYPELSIVHIDAHSDLYHEFKGNPYSNACPFARIMENKLATELYQFGIRTLTEHQVMQAKKFKVNIYEMKDWCGQLPTINGPIYLSIDIDAIDPAFAPGVSHREPGGFSSRELINLIHQLPNTVVGVDIVEFNPRFDIDNITANLAAKLVKEGLGKLGRAKY